MVGGIHSVQRKVCDTWNFSGTGTIEEKEEIWNNTEENVGFLFCEICIWNQIRPDMISP